MTMSRPELDGWLAAVDRLNGGSGRKDTSQTTRQSFKSLRKKRRKGKQKNGR
ncbi:TPA: hypothetical protein ACGBRJ_000755 [Escherichia coli]|uniref:Uncharacterized protein n=1 Tax=Escherichia coli TaxID=562 RepID=A0A8I0CGQ7_ECOLX|nr:MULTISPECIES: hypothetical protein [Enterobacteriaceae]EHN4653574.1 hypothetical protein [Escherichia coli]EHR8237312.1 hypothetical protein [Escherichia coli]EKI5265653.1 hypothetical protein [Escherichia coli]ELS5896630.1 hypothetical protein [Escherichia coli]ELU3412632.1 hypothetical protein [Escherichia coli]